jgi:hypothetical protein
MESDPNIDNKPVICGWCKSSLRMDALSQVEYWSLQAQHFYGRHQDELRMLLRVQNLYRRHPEIESIAGDIFQAHLFEEAESTYNTTLLEKLADSDFEVLEYLRSHGFALLPRLQFVRERMAHWEQYTEPVTCTVCKVGKLQLDTSTWINPYVISDPI